MSGALVRSALLETGSADADADADAVVVFVAVGDNGNI